MFPSHIPNGTLVRRAKSSEFKYQKGSTVVTRPTETESLLTPAEVAAMFRVDPKTVTRWAKAGKLSAIRTLGGHRRYRESEVKELLGDVIPAQRTARD
jgi:excisionase family DNA binding protein